MSDNHSPTVTPTSPAAHSPDDQLVSSRKPSQDDSHSPFTGTTATYKTEPSDSLVPHQTPAVEPQPPAPRTSRRRARSHTVPKLRARKRMRQSRDYDEEDFERARLSRSPSVSSSQDDDLGDDDLDPGGSPEQSLSASAATQPKKKRTRTLTTPHQSQVLHALLAQSRFPTTAMREDVGKQIGLSARKVQVWFQNQRQKARRPKAETTTPLTRPPQFGPFANDPASPHAQETTSRSGSAYSAAALWEAASPGGGSSMNPTGSHAPIAGTSSLPNPRHYARGRAGFGHEFSPPGPSAYPSQLAGPGVPGPSVGFDPYATRAFQPAPSGLPMAHPGSISPEEYAHRDYGGHTRDPGYGGRSAFPPPRSGYASPASGRQPPITLPPLQFDERGNRDAAASREYPRGHRISRPPSSMTSPLRSPVSPTGLPPPFALQPSPQWASPHYPGARAGPSPRPSSSSYVDPAAGPSHQLDFRREYAYDADRHAPPTPRMARFDPIRASFSEEPRPEARRPRSNEDDNARR